MKIITYPENDLYYYCIVAGGHVTAGIQSYTRRQDAYRGARRAIDALIQNEGLTGYHVDRQHLMDTPTEEDLS